MADVMFIHNTSTVHISLNSSVNNMHIVMYVDRICIDDTAAHM